MPSRVTLIIAAVLAALVAQGATAGGVALAPATVTKTKPAKPKPTNLAKSPDLWATINVCDTAKHPNTIGIRGSMPGLGNRRSHLALRIQVQYKAKSDGKWHNAGATADSKWKRIGSTLRQVIESGQDFMFKPPTDGGSHLLRGSIRFRWTRHGKVVARARRLSEPGHKSTAGADPKRYSAAQCEITQP
jgi:hypothetical protein